MQIEFYIKNKTLMRYKPGHSNINIPDAVTGIGEEVFKVHTDQSEITIPEGVTKIGGEAFHECTTLQNVTLPSTLKEIGERAFWGCTGLTEITIPEDVTKIGKAAFNYCINLRRVTLPSALERISKCQFYACVSLEEIIIPDGVTEILSMAFCHCNRLTAITLPRGVTIIDDCVFYNCSSLSEIAIPERVTKIGNSAFGGCKSLTEIIIPGNVTEIQSNAFDACSGNLKIIVEDDDKREKFSQMLPSFPRKNIVTISEKLSKVDYTSKQIIEINCLNYDDKLLFMDCNAEDQNIFVSYSKCEGGEAWEATNLDGNITRIEGVTSTVPCETLLELMRQYESKFGTPMRNIAPIIMEPSLENEDGRHSNYILAALNDLEVIQALEAAAIAAAEAAEPSEAVYVTALTYFQSLFGGFVVQRGVKTTTNKKEWYKGKTRSPTRSTEFKYL